MKKLIPLFTFTSRLHLLFTFVLLPLFANAETYNLIGQRHLRLYTAPEPTQSYNASIDAQTVADSLCNVPWTRATSAEATSTSHAGEQLDANVRNRDRFDAALFCAFHTNGLHTAFANAAVYRYKLPDGQLPNLTSLGVKVSSDPYNALGARIVLMASDTPDIPTDCSTVRGESGTGIKLSGIAPRITRTVDGKDYWYPASTNAVFGSQVLPAGGLQLRRHLFVFVLMENYSTSRGNWLEGCSWIDNLVSVSTDAPVPGWSDGQTVDLSDEAEDDPTSDGIRVDADKDGLTDFRERLASTVLTNLYGTTPVDQTKMMTYPGQLVPDYFLPVSSGSSGNWTYLGSLLTDHDFIEDWLEDSDELFSGDKRSSRYRHDAHEDYDGNGWDNWSEARAYLSTESYSGRPQPKGRIKVVYNGERNYTGNLVIKAYHYRNGNIPPMTVAEDETWTLPVGRKSAWYDLHSSSNSYLQAGKIMFVVYNDADADGAWTPGEPYGIVTDVEVGFAKIADSSVEITDVNPSILRIDIAGAADGNTFEAQKDLNDRGVNAASQVMFQNSSVYSEAYSNVLNQSSYVRVRVVRLSVNELTSKEYAMNTYYAMDTVLDTYVDVTRTPFLTEHALLLSSGQFDLDWGAVKVVGYNLGFGEGAVTVGKVTYGIVLGSGEINNAFPASKLNVLATTFSNAFEPLAQQTLANPLQVSFAANATRPTFTWEHPQDVKVYPAFKLRIWNGNTVVYDSGVRYAPPRDKDGKCSWTAPVFVGDLLENDTDYAFSVSMLDAKFTTPNSNETKFAFRTSANGVGGDVSDQNSIKACVKYFGHVSTSGKYIIAEVFDSPDFVGLPKSVTNVHKTSAMKKTDSLVPNATLIGLEKNKNFFVRAYIDLDGDRVLDQGEPWGYCNYVGESSRKDIYTPRPFSFGVGTTEMPTAVVYIEDSDVVPLDLSTIVTED